MKTIKVNKSDYFVDKMSGGQYVIMNDDWSVIFGGDPANEDDYNKEYIEDIYNKWNGILCNDDIHGYRINNDF